MRAVLLLLLIMTASQATAGPWPRAEDETYLSAGHEGGRDGWTSLYAERGLAGDWTLGLDAGGHMGGLALADPSLKTDGRARLFLRRPVLSDSATRPDWLTPWLAAVELSLGADMDQAAEIVPRLGAGVTVGRGFESRFGNGWTTLDLRATFGGGRRARLNAGAVLGVKPREGLALELGLFAEREGATYWTVAPTVQYELGRLGSARLGLSHKDDGRTLVRVGWATSF